MSTPFTRRLRMLALRDVDRAAGEARLRHITDIPGQAMVYLAKLQQAEAYRAAWLASPGTAVAGSYLVAEGLALAQSPIDVADAVLDQASDWNTTISPAIEAARMAGKAAVAAVSQDLDDAAYEVAVQAARDAAVQALGEL